MDEYGGIRLLESLWGLEATNTASEVKDWVIGILDEDDSILVLPFKPKGGYASTNVSSDAIAWLKRAHAN